MTELTGRFAMIVAADRYDDDNLKQLRAPASDASTLKQVLEDPNIGGFESETLINESAQCVREKVERFFSHREPEDLLLLYFACHGVKDRRGRLYLAMSDTRLDLIASSAISAHFINEEFEACRSRRMVLILDCCYSGAYARGLAPRGSAQVGVFESFQGEGRVVLTASDAIEYAFEEDQLTGGTGHSAIFTGAMIRGLKTGDADLDQDGRVSVDDLYGFTYREVRKRTSDQTPGKVDMVRGSLYLAANPRKGSPPLTSEADPFVAMTSDHRWEREDAALGLRALTANPDPDVAQAAHQALERLSSDDERSVRASADAALGDVAGSHFERALVLANAGDLVAADAEFQNVMDLDIADLVPFAHFNRGALAARAGRPGDAARYFALALDSGRPAIAARAALNLGCISNAAGDMKSAASMYKKAMSYGESEVDARAAFLLARLEERKGNRSVAWFYYAKATDHDGHPFIAAAKTRYYALMRSAKRTEIFARVLGLAGYPNVDEESNS